MKVCYFGTYRAQYVRNVVMIERLKRAGVEVITCHETLWQGIEDRVQIATGGWKNFSFWKRLFLTYWRLLVRYLAIEDHDILIVGYPGQLDVILARILSWIRRKPLVWDILMSIYLVSVDRGLDESNHLSMFMLKSLERISCHLPDLLIQDTEDYIEWFIKNYKVPQDKFKLVPIGADDRIFHPVDYESNHEKFKVLYFGTFIRNHHVETIIHAADLLRNFEDIEFELIGTGPDYSLCKDLTQTLHLTNVIFTGWMDETELAVRINQADVILGIFGTSYQSLITIHNKIYIGLAVGKPVITAATPALEKVFVNKVHMLQCNLKDAQSLKDTVLELKKDPKLRDGIAENGYRLYQEKFSLDRLGELYSSHLRELLH